MIKYLHTNDNNVKELQQLKIILNLVPTNNNLTKSLNSERIDDNYAEDF